MRFLHAADVHLDSPLRGLEQYQDAPVAALRGATRKALEGLVRLAIAERVDFVVLAGDLYDGDWPDYNTGLFFVNRMRELEEAGIPVFLIRGNHDAESRITSQLTLPANVHSFSTEKPETKTLDKLRVALHGQGFAKQAENRNLAATYPLRLANHFNIGLLHTSLDGREGHASYAPCQLSDLISRDYDYWALGHVHQRESVHATNHPRVEFPGNIQGRHARETGAKGCLLVQVDNRQQVTTEFRSLDVLRWELIPVNGADADSASDLLSAIREAVSEKQEEAEGRMLAARLVISCGDAIRRLVAADIAQFRADLCGQFGDAVWIEKVKWQPLSQPQTHEPSLHDDAASELQAVLAEIQADPAAAQQVLAEGECEKLLKTLPAEMRTMLKNAWPEIVHRAAILLQVDGQEARS